MLYEFPPIDGPMELRITLEASQSRPQAIRLKARAGTIWLNDQPLDDVVLWSDSMPPVVTAALRPQSSEEPMTLRVWNAWRDPTGTMQAWIGDAGMIIEEPSPDTVVLHGSDGFDAPTFDDLVATFVLNRTECA
jgi:hypothetical protein